MPQDVLSGPTVVIKPNRATDTILAQDNSWFLSQDAGTSQGFGQHVTGLTLALTLNLSQTGNANGLCRC